MSATVSPGAMWSQAITLPGFCQAVRSAENLTADEALARGVIDLVAQDIPAGREAALRLLAASPLSAVGEMCASRLS